MPGMRTQILKKRIFLSNALMILLTLAAVALVNLAAVKIRWEFIERDWESSITEYSEPLARRLIEKVTVFDEKLVVEFKSGLQIDVEA